MYQDAFILNYEECKLMFTSAQNFRFAIWFVHQNVHTFEIRSALTCNTHCNGKTQFYELKKLYAITFASVMRIYSKLYDYTIVKTSKCFKSLNFWRRIGELKLFQRLQTFRFLYSKSKLRFVLELYSQEGFYVDNNFGCAMMRLRAKRTLKCGYIVWWCAPWH